MRDFIRCVAAGAAFAFALVAGAAHSSEALSLGLKSSAVLVIDEETGEILYDKNADAVVPIASITKLVTAMVTLDAALPLEEEIVISDSEVAATKGVRSNLRPGTKLTRDALLQLALMSSENRAAAALGRTYPGGMEAFVQAMNDKVAELDMYDSRFVEPTGLSSSNVSSAGDLAKLVRTAKAYPLIREYSTQPSAAMRIGKRPMTFVNTNGLVRGGSWEIGLQKTGFIREAGRCLVMQAKFAARSVIIVLLDSVGKYTRIGDANRIRQWLEPSFTAPIIAAARQSKTRAKAPVVKATRTANGRVRAQIDPPRPR